MTASVSIFLDLLRFSAALTVVIGHLTQRFFSTGWPDLTLAGVAAVSVFFVLSGFVIRHVTETRENNLESYLVARFARIYSVLIPAVVLTVSADFLSNDLDPAFYRSWIEQSDGPGFRILASLGFFNEWHGRDIALFSNSPVWSLGYEIPYYLLYAAFTFLAGAYRALAVIVMLCAFGLNIILLLPIWLFGVLLHDVLKTRRPSRKLGLLLLLIMALLLIAAWPLVPTVRAMLPNWPLFLGSLGRSVHFVLFYLVGLATCCLIAAVAAFEEELESLFHRFERWIRLLASSTFSIYLFHFPLLVLIYALTHYDKGSSGAKVLVFFVAVGICFLLSRFTEAKKSDWASLINWVLGKLKRLRPAP